MGKMKFTCEPFIPQIQCQHFGFIFHASFFPVVLIYKKLGAIVTETTGRKTKLQAACSDQAGGAGVRVGGETGWGRGSWE